MQYNYLRNLPIVVAVCVIVGATILFTRNATVMFDVVSTPILKVLHLRGRLYYNDVKGK